MIVIWKNKGLLVLLYVVVTFMGVAILEGVLDRNIGGIFSHHDFYRSTGISFLIAAFWTYKTKDDFFKDKEGKKIKLDTVNELFFIPMGIWAYILLALGLIFLGNSVFGYFDSV